MRFTSWKKLQTTILELTGNNRWHRGGKMERKRGLRLAFSEGYHIGWHNRILQRSRVGIQGSILATY